MPVARYALPESIKKTFEALRQVRYNRFRSVVSEEATKPIRLFSSVFPVFHQTRDPRFANGESHL